MEHQLAQAGMTSSHIHLTVDGMTLNKEHHQGQHVSVQALLQFPANSHLAGNTLQNPAAGESKYIKGMRRTPRRMKVGEAIMNTMKVTMNIKTGLREVMTIGVAVQQVPEEDMEVHLHQTLHLVPVEAAVAAAAVAPRHLLHHLRFTRLAVAVAHRAHQIHHQFNLQNARKRTRLKCRIYLKSDLLINGRGISCMRFKRHTL